VKTIFALLLGGAAGALVARRLAGPSPAARPAGTARAVAAGPDRVTVDVSGLDPRP